MNKAEATAVLSLLKASYPNSMRDLTEGDADAMSALWASQFADIPAQIVMEAVREAINSSSFFPSVSDIRQRLTDRRDVAWMKLHWQKNAMRLGDRPPFNLGQIETEARVYRALGGQMNLEWLHPILPEVSL